MYIQVMTEEQARNYRENPFDITKVWPHGEFPLIEVGELELNRNPENYFVDVEQSAFTPVNLVPGLGLSPDKLLQGRIFAYGDAQRYRLGVNHNLIPVNAPKCPVNSYHRDGMMRTDDNFGSRKSYVPNSYGEWKENGVSEPALAIEGDIDRYDPSLDREDDVYRQPGDLYRLMKPAEKDALIDNTARNMAAVTENIKYRHAAHCYRADPDYGYRLADAMGLKRDAVQELAGLTEDELRKRTWSV